MLLVNASFVGGYGATRKVLSLIKALEERKVDYQLVTDIRFRTKLDDMHIRYDHVIPWGQASVDKYHAVDGALKRITYDAMISFGWRTFVPAHAVSKGKPCIIVDGGWPEALQDWPGEFCHDVYKALAAYCLTTHFVDTRLYKLLPQDSRINFEWIAQPFGTDEIDWHVNLANKRLELRNVLKKRFPLLDGDSKLVFLNMSPDYVDPRQFDHAGGFLTSAQYDECRGFVSRLIVELDQSDNYTLFMLENVRRQVEPIIATCKNLLVFSEDFLDAETHHQLRCAADLVLCRAIRDVSSAQVALSGQRVLHTICPARDGYMGELDSARIAQHMGIATVLEHELEAIVPKIQHCIESDTTVAMKAQTIAERFTRLKGVDYLLNLVG